MQRFQQGDASAFGPLHARHAPAATRFFIGMTGSRATADDLTQTTFLKLVAARASWSPSEPFLPWFWAVARNAARDHLRRGSTVREQSRSDDLPEQAAEPVDPLAGESARADAERLQRALRELPAAQREAVVLHHLEGRPFAEVAASLGIRVGAAKVRAHRGYVRLRELLGGVREGQR